MPTPSLDAFVDLLGRSGVVEPARLTAYLDKLRAADALPSDPARLASLMIRDALLTSFQAQQLLAGKWRGFFIGKYKVLEKIGSGGMGTVYLAEHKFMKRRVAIKVLPKARALEPSSLERFYREAKAIAALDHPNIVRAYDVDVDRLADGTDLHFLVMEYVDGISFQDWVKARGPLDPPRAAHYIYQAAQGLHHAHTIGLVHRDIKPGNLLVDRHGIVKILDMGLARFFHDEEDLLTKKYDENVLGTADYLAPEQAIDSHTVDIRADIYSLGGTFYFMLTGRSPFGEGTVAQKLIWHQTRRPKPILELRPDVPADIVAVVEKMMEKSPADRYQTPLEVAEALSAYAFCDRAAPPETDLPELSPAARGVASEVGEPGTSARSWPAPASGPQPPASPTPKPSPPSSTARTNVPAAPTTSDAAAAAPASTPRPHSGRPPAPASAGSPRSRPAAASTREASPPASPPPRSPGPRPRPKPAAAQPPAVSTQTADSPPPPDADDTPFAASQESDFSWAQVADTGHPSDRSTDTVPSRTRTSHFGRSRTLAWSQWSRRTRILVLAGTAAGGAVLLALAVVLLAFALRRGEPPTRAKAPPATVAPAPPPRNTLFVSKSRVAASDYTTLREALERAIPGDRILIRDQEVYEESLVVTPASGLGKRNLLVEAEADSLGRTAILKAPGAEPVLVLDRVEDFVLKGLRLDGGGQAEDLVRVNGACPGSRLEEVHFHGFRRAAVRLDGCEGQRGREIVFRNCRFLSGQPPAESAIAFGPAAPGSPVQPIRYVHFADCRLSGPTGFAGVVLAAPSVGIVLERNVFAGLKAPAVLLPASAPANPALRLQLLHNTFWDCATGLTFQQRLRLDSNVQMTGNLFYRLTGPGVGAIENDTEPLTFTGYVVGQDNIYDAATPTGNIAAVSTLHLTRMTFDLPTADPEAEDFLRFPAGHPLATAVEQKQPAGALPPLP
jgi:serine/threonine protein kinase